MPFPYLDPARILIGPWHRMPVGALVFADADADQPIKYPTLIVSQQPAVEPIDDDPEPVIEGPTFFIALGKDHYWTERTEVAGTATALIDWQIEVDPTSVAQSFRGLRKGSLLLANGHVALVAHHPTGQPMLFDLRTCMATSRPGHGAASAVFTRWRLVSLHEDKPVVLVECEADELTRR